MNADRLTQSLVDWSTTLVRLTMHDFNHHIRLNGLSLIQLNVLLHLHYQGPSEVMNFCELMQVSPAGASQMIERMVQQGVVQRSEAAIDRRVRLVGLTEAGRRIVDEILASRQAWVEELTSELSEPEKEKLVESLQVLMEKARRLEQRVQP